MIVYGWGGSYNKRDSSYRWGACESCGQVGHLHNYTSTRFFSIYFVPLIPHGSMRAMDQCAACDHGKALSLRKWKKLRRTQLQPALEAHSVTPSDRETADNTLSLVIELGEEDEFLSVASSIAKTFSGDAAMLAKLGCGFAYFGKLHKATRCLERSLQTKENAEVRETLEFFSSQSMTPTPPGPNRLLQMAPTMVLPGIALAVLFFAVVGATAASPKNVFVVNGLDIPYSVLVNGERMKLPAGGRVRADVGYGTLSVEPAPGDLPIDPAEMEIEAAFFSRDSDKLLFVINPDRSALIVWDEVTYGDESRTAATGGHRLHVGEPYYSFPNTDYPFRDSPKTVKPRSGRPMERRYRVTQVEGASALERVSRVMEELDREAAASYLKNTLTLNPAAQDLVRLLYVLLEEDEALALIEPMLTRRPVLVQWHRYYQQLIEQVQPQRRLAAEYKELLSAEPRNTSLAYLVGRVVDDPEEAQEYFQRAITGKKPEPYGHYAIGYAHAIRSEFPEALAAVRRAMKLASNDVGFAGLEQELMVATGKWKQLAKRRRQELKQAPYNWTTVAQLVATLSADGEVDAVRSTIRDYLGKLKELGEASVSSDQISEIRSILLATQAQWTGDSAEFIKAARNLDEPEWKLRAALAQADVQRAATLVAENVDLQEGGFTHLGLYALASSVGKPALAERQLATALERFREGPKDHRWVAEWLADGGQAPTLQETFKAGIQSNQRRLVLVALGTRYPDAQDQFFGDARKHNFDHDIWYFPVRQIAGARP